MTHTDAGIRSAFHSQGKSCVMLGSPFMGQLMPLIGERLTDRTEVGARILSWDGDPGPAGQSVPLRLAGALHGLVLSGADDGLTEVYPPQDTTDDALWEAVEAALTSHEQRIMAWLDRPPQTNEVRRSSVLLPALWWVLERTGPRPIELSELGASAGLNLSVDHFAIETPDRLAGPASSPVVLRPQWRAPPPADRLLNVVTRRGVDRHPVDPRDPADALRLLSYIWPDQPDRMALTRGAISLSQGPPDDDDAAPWLEKRMSNIAPNRLHVVYTTIAWQYFPPETQARCMAALTDAGSAARADTPLAHIAFEADGQGEGAALTVRLWPQTPEPQLLARADFHGRWVDWNS